MQFALTRVNDFKKHFLFIAVVLIIAAVCLGILEDYLHAQRNNHGFYLSESLLFKCFWLVFLPILALLKRLIEKEETVSLVKSTVYLLGSTVFHLLAVPLAIWCISAMFREQSYGVYKVLTYTLSNDLIKIVLVYICAIYYFVHMSRRSPGNSADDEREQDISSITVSSGKSNHLITLSDILYIQSASPYVAINTQHKEFLHSATLKSIQKTLNQQFVRIHRSTIVNLNKVDSYHSRLNGDYDIHLINGAVLRLSRNYVSHFREAAKSAPQLSS